MFEDFIFFLTARRSESSFDKICGMTPRRLCVAIKAHFVQVVTVSLVGGTASDGSKNSKTPIDCGSRLTCFSILPCMGDILVHYWVFGLIGNNISPLFPVISN